MLFWPFCLLCFYLAFLRDKKIYTEVASTQSSTEYTQVEQFRHVRLICFIFRIDYSRCFQNTCTMSVFLIFLFLSLCYHLWKKFMIFYKLWFSAKMHELFFYLKCHDLPGNWIRQFPLNYVTVEWWWISCCKWSSLAVVNFKKVTQ